MMKWIGALHSLWVTGSYGAIIRDHRGEVLAAAAGSDVPRTITQHELQAVEMGLTLAQQKQLPRVMVASDSQCVVSAITETYGSSVAVDWAYKED